MGMVEAMAGQACRGLASDNGLQEGRVFSSKSQDLYPPLIYSTDFFNRRVNGRDFVFCQPASDI